MNAIDAFVQKAISGTCGIMYKSLIDRLTCYPIPQLPLPQGNNKHFLDIGCNWGRWCISATRKGYQAIGIDPSLDAIKAARRVSKQLASSVQYVVADARHLPFAPNSFDMVFSYSVLQHFDKDDVKLTLAEVERVLRMSGMSMIQMANMFGLHNLYNQWKRTFRDPVGFEVRYWMPADLKKIFNNFIGPTSLCTDGFFSLNPRIENIKFFPLRYKFVVTFSEMLRKLGEKVKVIKYFADSLYVKSIKRD